MSEELNQENPQDQQPTGPAVPAWDPFDQLVRGSYKLSDIMPAGDGLLQRKRSKLLYNAICDFITNHPELASEDEDKTVPEIVAVLMLTASAFSAVKIGNAKVKLLNKEFPELTDAHVEKLCTPIYKSIEDAYPDGGLSAGLAVTKTVLEKFDGDVNEVFNTLSKKSKELFGEAMGGCDQESKTPVDDMLSKLLGKSGKSESSATDSEKSAKIRRAVEKAKAAFYENKGKQD